MKNFLNKLLLVVMAFVLSLSVVGCKKNKDQGNESEKESNYATAILAMRNELENNYGEDSLKHLEVVSNLLNNCSSSLEVEEILSGWDYSLCISYFELLHF